MYNKKVQLYLLSNFRNYIEPPSLKEIKKKNLNEVFREFNKEEWKKLYQKVKKNNLTNIKEVDHEYNNLNQINTYFHNNKFYKKKNLYILNKYIDIYIKTLTTYLTKNKTYNIVELGSGYGSKIINLADKLNKNYKINYYSGELSSNGRKISDFISSNNNLNVKTFNFNFLDKESYKLIPLNSIIYTSYSMHYMYKIKNSLFNNLKKRKPILVINFEPLFEIHDERTTHGNLCKNYILKNGYCINHYSLMQKMVKQKKIEIIKFEKNIFGSNPILPLSKIIWKFK